MGDAEFSGERDLFGDPVIYRDAGPGRPPHERTAENANKVSLLFAMGRTISEAATALGITQPTLRKHYFSEVAQRDAMLLKLEADQLSRLHAETVKGNVGAMKELMARADRASLLGASRRVKARKADEPVKPAAKGKKQEQIAAAENVGGKFGTRAPPPRLIN